MFISYFLFVLGITIIQFIVSRRRNGKSIDNSFHPIVLLGAAFFNCFWPLYIVVVLLEHSPIGQIIPTPNLDDVRRADSLQSVPNTPNQGYNAGNNISNSPDQL